MIDIEIDKLTNSIENAISGDSFETELQELEKNDLIKEPKEIDFYVVNEPITPSERELLLEAISNYKTKKKKSKKQELVFAVA
jgi:hypothetical protein